MDLAGYNKDLQKKESILVDIGRLSDQDEKNDLIPDNKEESDASSFHLVLSQIAYNNCQPTKKHKSKYDS